MALVDLFSLSEVSLILEAALAASGYQLFLPVIARGERSLLGWLGGDHP